MLKAVKARALISIYVFGLFPISPGKTVVSTALCRALLNRGFKVAPFKPRSGHNLWYQYDAFKKCKKESRLFCEDIIKLKEASRCYLPYEILNPVDALMAPLDAGDFLEKNYVREMYLKEGDTFSHLLVERYTSCEEGNIKSIICLNEKSLSRKALTDRDYIHDLMEQSDDVVTVEDESGWISAFRRFGPRSISTCARRIAEEHEVIVVEGFNDAVCPAPELRYDAVAGVGPGAAAMFDSGDFERVIKLKSMIGVDPMGLRSEDIVEFIKPERILAIPALDNGVLTDFDQLSKTLVEMVDAILKQLSY